MIGMSYGFYNLGVPLTVGAAFFAPFGGQAVWDGQPGVAGFPGSADGPQRWYTIDGTIRTLSITGGAAYYIEPARLSIGATANYLSTTVQTLRARTSAGDDRLQNEGRSYIDAAGTDLSFGVGALWEAIEDRLWVGVSYQSRPNLDGRQALEGTLRNYFTPNDSSESIVFTQQLPDIYRLGFRYRIDPQWEVRLFGDYSRWSAMRQQCVVNTQVLGDQDPTVFCRTRENGRLVEPGNNAILAIPRRWEDAFGFRVGTSYFVSDRLELQLDLGFDGNAIPDEALEPALMDMNKVSTGLGAYYQFTDWFGLAVNATNIFYFERDTTGARTANTFLPPSKQPSSEGIYNQNIFLLNTGFYLSF
jgi:long-chain fatty acid transport protein